MPNGMTVPRHHMAPGRGPMHHDRGGEYSLAPLAVVLGTPLRDNGLICAALYAAGRGGGQWAGRGAPAEAGPSMPEGAGMPGGHFTLPLPPQHEDSRDERGMPGPPGPMQVALQPVSLRHSKGDLEYMS